MLIVQLEYTPEQAGEMTLNELGWIVERGLYRESKEKNGQMYEPVPDDYDVEGHIKRAVAVYDKFNKNKAVA